MILIPHRQPSRPKPIVLDGACGVQAIDYLLSKVYRVRIDKALNPLNPRDYLVLVKRFKDALRKVTGDAEKPAIASAMSKLNVDWARMTEAQRKRVAAAANDALRGVPTVIAPQVETLLKARWIEVVQGARTAIAAETRMAVTTNFLAVDKGILDYAVRAQNLYFKDEYNKRADAFGQKARDIVERGLREGVGRKALGAQIEQAMLAANINRSRAYCDLIASTFMNRSRTYGSLSAYDELQIETYTFEAVLDEVTTAVCRFNHGRRFPVKKPLDKMRSLADTKQPEEIKYALPWVHEGKDQDGNAILYYKDKAGERVVIADVLRSGVGVKDDQGSYKQRMSDAQLVAAGAILPPLHGNCRSRIVADLNP